jgi:hypothetical protein
MQIHHANISSYLCDEQRTSDLLLQMRLFLVCEPRNFRRVVAERMRKKEARTPSSPEQVGPSSSSAVPTQRTLAVARPALA